MIFGTKRVSRNSGITNFETLFNTKIPNRVQNFSKVPIFSYFFTKLLGIFLHIHQVIHENFEVDAKKIQQQKTRYRESSISMVSTCTDF